jgi:hypothetical protein
LATLTIAALFAAVPFFAGAWLGSEPILGLPPRTFALMLAAPAAIAVVLFWHIGRQDRLNRRFDVGEE